MPSYLTDSRGRIDDSRNLLEKLRRRELEAILAHENIQAPKDVPATLARELIRMRGVDVMRYLDERGAFRWPKPEKPKPERVPLDMMTIAQMRAQCTALGIGWSPTQRKAELRKRLEEALDGHAA